MSTLAGFPLSPVARTLAVDPPLSDLEFERLCLQSQVAYERRKDGLLVMNPPTGLMTGDANAEILRQLGNWYAATGAGLKGRVCDSSTGFFLPDGSMLSPDAAFIPPDQLVGLTKAELTGIPRLCPAFVIELKSVSDSLAEMEAKMQQWALNGAKLGWLVDPYRQQVTVYRPGESPIEVTGLAVDGSGPVEGFVLNLGPVWRCFQTE